MLCVVWYLFVLVGLDFVVPVVAIVILESTVTGLTVSIDRSTDDYKSSEHRQNHIRSLPRIKELVFRLYMAICM